MRISYLFSIGARRLFGVKDVDPLGAKLDIGGLRVAVGTTSLTPCPMEGRYVEIARWIAIAYALTRFPLVVRRY